MPPSTSRNVRGSDSGKEGSTNDTVLPCANGLPAAYARAPSGGLHESALGTLGATLDAVVKAGSNEIGGISFGLSDPARLLDEAREAAMTDAQHKATQLAELARVSLGAVVSISEAGASPPPLIRRSLSEMAAAAPIEVGVSTVSVMVEVSYELVP